MEVLFDRVFYDVNNSFSMTIIFFLSVRLLTLAVPSSPQPLVPGEVHVGVDVGAAGGRVAAAHLLQEQPADGRRRGPHVRHVGLQQQGGLGPQQEGPAAAAQEARRG